MTSARALLDVAIAEIGYVESGGPDGRSGNVTKYWAELDPAMQGQSWCAAFVSYVYKHAGAPLPAVGKPYGFVYVPSAIDYARRHSQAVIPYRPGDILCYWNGRHTGIFEAPNMDGSLLAIEGNTSPSEHGSQDNGGGVYRKVRHNSDVTVAWRPFILDQGADVALTDADKTFIDAAVAKWVNLQATETDKKIDAVAADVAAIKKKTQA